MGWGSASAQNAVVHVVCIESYAADGHVDASLIRTQGEGIDDGKGKRERERRMGGGENSDLLNDENAGGSAACRHVATAAFSASC
jgi:hypothetical protein